MEILFLFQKIFIYILKLFPGFRFSLSENMLNDNDLFIAEASINNDNSNVIIEKIITAGLNNLMFYFLSVTGIIPPIS